ncbi:MAG: RHS repeat-associated core domain-containing protein [Verrucomicrobiota bacterium]
MAHGSRRPSFYPYGLERTEDHPRRVDDEYKYSQKERDRESGLHYFEARYMAAAIARFISVDPKYLSPDNLSDEERTSFLAKPQSLNLYAYALNNPLTYNDPSGLDAVSTVSTGSDIVGIAAGGAEEFSLWSSLAGVNTPKWVDTGANVAGKVTAGISVGIKAAQFIDDPSSATGGQLANESAKALTGLAAPPVGLIWSVLDLTGYGPSAILEATEQSIQANRAAAKAYRHAAEINRQTAAMLNKAVPRIEAQQRQAAAALKVLKQETAKLNETTSRALKGETRSLEQLNAEIKRMEAMNRRSAAELKRLQAQARKVEQ